MEVFFWKYKIEGKDGRPVSVTVTTDLDGLDATTMRSILTHSELV
jgi:hypothetical protein